MMVVGLCISLFFVWMFGLASFHKLSHLSHYGGLIEDYGIGHKVIAKLLALLIGCVELVITVMLLVPVTRELALVAAIMMLVVYATAMAVQLILGHRQLKCGCAGPASNTQVSAVLVVRNITLVLLALVALAVGSNIVMSSYSLLLVACLATFMILLYLCAEQLISNGQQLAGLRN